AWTRARSECFTAWSAGKSFGERDATVLSTIGRRSIRFGRFENANERTGRFRRGGGPPLQTRCGPYCWRRLFERRQHRCKHVIASSGNHAWRDSISRHGAPESGHITRPLVCARLDRRG